MTPLDIHRVRRELPEKRIEYCLTVDSTMNVAARLAAGAVVVAEEQTAGQGRHGHSWHSEPGAGIYCSMVLAPSPALTLALGLAAQNAISEATGLHCDLRWPNDLILGVKKVAGVLAQGSDGRAIAGIGINVNQTSFPPELAGEAASLRGWGRTAGPELSREDILIALLRAVDLYAALPGGDILRLFTQFSSYARGRHVVVQQADGVIEGITAGLDPAGFLIVRKDDGTDTLILAGGVRAAGA
jgi:BirA family transcriptional regulator, biotin operon repressor / biotin---[acetyl-CoA-carboxylase] ligase